MCHIDSLSRAGRPLDSEVSEPPLKNVKKNFQFFPCQNERTKISGLEVMRGCRVGRVGDDLNHNYQSNSSRLKYKALPVYIRVKIRRMGH